MHRPSQPSLPSVCHLLGSPHRTHVPRYCQTQTAPKRLQRSSKSSGCTHLQAVHQLLLALERVPFGVQPPFRQLLLQGGANKVWKHHVAQSAQHAWQLCERQMASAMHIPFTTMVHSLRGSRHFAMTPNRTCSCCTFMAGGSRPSKPSPSAALLPDARSAACIADRAQALTLQRADQYTRAAACILHATHTAVHCASARPVQAAAQCNAGQPGWCGLTALAASSSDLSLASASARSRFARSSSLVAARAFCAAAMPDNGWSAGHSLPWPRGKNAHACCQTRAALPGQGYAHLQLHVRLVVVGGQRPGVNEVHHHMLHALRQALGRALRPQVGELAEGHPLRGGGWEDGGAGQLQAWPVTTSAL